MTKASPQTQRSAVVNPRKPGAMQANILAAAVQLFAQTGFDGVSIRGIASASSATLASIYHYYADKQALYEAACQHAFAVLSQKTLMNIKKAGDAENRLESYVRNHLKMLMKPSVELSLVIRELNSRQSRALDGIALNILAAPSQSVTEMIAELSSEVDAQALAELLMSAIFGEAQMMPIRARLHPAPEEVELDVLARRLTALVLSAAKGAPFTPASRASGSGSHPAPIPLRSQSEIEQSFDLT